MDGQFGTGLALLTMSAAELKKPKYILNKDNIANVDYYSNLIINGNTCINENEVVSIAFPQDTVFPPHKDFNQNDHQTSNKYTENRELYLHIYDD